MQSKRAREDNKITVCHTNVPKCDPEGRLKRNKKRTYCKYDNCPVSFKSINI